ncbi:phage portal protein [Prauserella endophytica]|uniref:Phage portal protein n=1 Tax=Prauserella endophytica TaxID=1592324 RepID=A0ABY2RSS4_9PSEU|nr:phage portal protein [Prauserella endophytica]TKG58889.1 phage portal protein [Prauserella endophytica]
MRVWERLVGREEQRHASLNFQDWVDLFKYGNEYYPLLQTTMGSVSEEQIAQNATAAYRSNGIVFALTYARMQIFSQIRFQWTRYESGAPSDLFGSPELGLLERPWPGGTTGDLLARMELDASLAGNCYIRRTRRDRLNRLRPDWVTIVLGSQYDAEHPNEAPDVEVVGYLYKPPNGRAIALDPSEVAHYAPIPEPELNFLGMSWITPAMGDVQADDASTVHKRAFFKNAATPNLAIKFDPSVKREQVLEFKEIIEENHTGAWNAYKTLFLGGGADPKVIGKDFRELEFAVTQGKGESRLASDAGVPPSWVGFSEGLQGSALNAGNFTAARRRFGDGTMQHLWGNVCASLEPIIPGRPQGASLWFSTKGIPFLAQDSKDAAEIQNKEAQTITALVRDGFTAESAIEAVRNHDWSLLKHTGLVSVQMQLPGETITPTGGGDE